MAFLAAATGLVVVLHNATKGTSPSVAGTEDAAVSALGFPPIAAADHLDGAYPSLFGRGSAEAALDPLQKGGVLFVFADPTQETGLESARVAIDVHRRLRAREVRVVLVVPRGAFAGNRTDEASILEALGHAGVVTDVEVLLDPSDERGAGHWRRTVFHVFDEAGAVLWEEGREAWRVTPPDPGGALQLAWLKSAVLRLWEEYPRKEVPPPPPTPAAVVPGKPMPSDEEVEAGGEENPPPGQR